MSFVLAGARMPRLWLKPENQESSGSLRTRIESGLRIPFKERTAVGKKYQRKVRKSNHKFEAAGEQS